MYFCMHWYIYAYNHICTRKYSGFLHIYTFVFYDVIGLDMINMTWYACIDIYIYTYILLHMCIHRYSLHVAVFSYTPTYICRCVWYCRKLGRLQLRILARRMPGFQGELLLFWVVQSWVSHEEAPSWTKLHAFACLGGRRDAFCRIQGYSIVCVGLFDLDVAAWHQ